MIKIVHRNVQHRPWTCPDIHESLAATTDMAVLPGVLGRSFEQAQDRGLTLRRTVQVRLGTNPAGPATVARWHAHLHGLATAIHEIFGLRVTSAPAAFEIQMHFLHPVLP